jgi:hypothetical protein
MKNINISFFNTFVLSENKKEKKNTYRTVILLGSFDSRTIFISTLCSTSAFAEV